MTNDMYGDTLRAYAGEQLHSLVHYRSARHSISVLDATTHPVDADEGGLQLHVVYLHNGKTKEYTFFYKDVVGFIRDLFFMASRLQHTWVT